MTMTNDKIIGTMTIREAAALWADPRREYLKRWGETFFGVTLQQLHHGHVMTYQKDRGKEATASQVDAEVGALLALLKQIGLGDEIERRNQSLGDAGEITVAEFNALPEPARKYIDKLRRRIHDLQAENGRKERRFRQTTWGR
jgi:hypothetical protein